MQSTENCRSAKSMWRRLRVVLRSFWQRNQLSYGILDKYVGKSMVLTVLVIALCLTLFTGLVTFIDSMRYIGRGSIGFWFVCEYVLLLAPGFIVTFFPVSILIGGVIALGNMARNSEIVVLQSLGLSRTNIAVSALKSLLPLILVVMALGEYVAPPMEQYAEYRYSVLSSNGAMSVSKSGVWLKEGQSFIGIRFTLSDGTLREIVRYDVDEQKGLQAVRRAESARYENGEWVMNKVVVSEFSPAQVNTSHYDTQYWKLNFTPDRIDVMGNSGSYLTMAGLKDYINYLKSNEQDASRYQLELYTKYMQPLIMVVMLFLALSTVFGPLRSMTMGTRILAGITLGFGYYVLNQIVAPFSLVYGIPPLIGSSMATVVFGCIAFYLLRRRA